jgi:hypothetical protein
MVTITYLEEKLRKTGNGMVFATVIKCVEFGERKISGWKGRINYKWQVGDRVDVAVSKKKSKDKKVVFYNYKPVDSIPPEIENRVSGFKLKIDEKIKKYISDLGLTVEELIQFGILVARILTLPDKKRMYVGMGWLTKRPIQELINYRENGAMA